MAKKKESSVGLIMVRSNWLSMDRNLRLRVCRPRPKMLDKLKYFLVGVGR